MQITKKHDINDYSFAHLTLILLLHYVVKCKSSFWRLQQWIHTGYRMPAQKIIARPENHWKSVTYFTFISSKSTVPRSWTSTNWNDASAISGPLWVLNVLMPSVHF